MINRENRKKIIIASVILVAFFSGVVCLINLKIINYSKSYIESSVSEVSSAQAAIVLGALVYQNGEMSDIFADRVKTGLELYESGKVIKILISGDHGRADYDEVNAAREYLIENGVKAEDVFMDHAGFDTYDSLYRAKEIFKIESAIVVTQNFHLPRAVYIGRKLDMDVRGMSADRQTYIREAYNNRREFLARIKAFMDITLNTSPKYLGDEILITGDGQESWD